MVLSEENQKHSGIYKDFRVTSTYYSPTLQRGIAMGLVHKGPERVGEIIDFPKVDGTIVKVKIVDQVFYDKDGEKQNV